MVIAERMTSAACGAWKAIQVAGLPKASRPSRR